MAKLRVVDRSGGEHVLEHAAGARVMEVLRTMEWGVLATCGGNCTCATCHVYVDREWYGRIPPKQIDETEILSVLSFSRDNSRLSCQIELTESLSGLRLALAPPE